MSTKLVRMQSGEDVICNLVEDTDDYIVIENAIVAVPTGQGQMGFAPWSPLMKEKETLTVRKSYVVYITDANDNITEQYEGLFSTVITPKKNLIL